MRIATEERGVSAVELALVLTVLFLVLFGTIQFGIAFNRSQGLEAAAREGARLASIGATHAEIESRVREAQSMFVGTDVVVTTSPASLGAERPCQIAGTGALVEVRAEVPASDKYAIAIPLWGQRQITYTAVGKFRCERAVP